METDREEKKPLLQEKINPYAVKSSDILQTPRSKYPEGMENMVRPPAFCSLHCEGRC